MGVGDLNLVADDVTRIRSRVVDNLSDGDGGIQSRGRCNVCPDPAGPPPPVALATLTILEGAFAAMLTVKLIGGKMVAGRQAVGSGTGYRIEIAGPARAADRNERQVRRQGSLTETKRKSEWCRR